MRDEASWKIPLTTNLDILDHERSGGDIRELNFNPYEVPKIQSGYLRHPLMEEMQNETIFVSDECIGLIKFHGGYQQDDRDKRARGEMKKYQFMLRLKMPAGECPPGIFQTIDDVSESFGNQTLRLTTRSSFQIHGILKSNLKTVMGTIARAGAGLYGASGDCSRNVITTPAPIHSPDFEHVRYTAKMMAEVFALQSRAFIEMWLDDEMAATVEYWKKDIDMEHVHRIMNHDNGRNQLVADAEEPIYGKTYLPRKFKIGITVPGDNSIDIYTHDVGLVVLCDKNGHLEGYNVLVGGGMGRNHNKDETFARAADPLGYVPAHAIYDVLKSIVAVQRDHGNRAVRTNARMKYLVHRVGIDRFRELVRSYMDNDGSALQTWRDLPAWKFIDWLGWHEDLAGKWFLGLYVLNGRLKDELKKVLRKIADTYNYPFVVTPQQNIIIAEVPTEEKDALVQMLKNHGVETDPDAIDPLVRGAMACPAP